MNTIIRVQHDAQNHYTMLSRAVLQDPELRLEETGLLVFMLSRPDGWHFNTRELAKARHCSRERIARILNALVRKGYARRITIKGEPRATGGRLDRRELFVFEEKQGPEGESSRWPAFRATGARATGNRAVEIRDPESSKERGSSTEAAPASSPPVPVPQAPSGDEYRKLLQALMEVRKKVGAKGRMTVEPEDRRELLRLLPDLGPAEIAARFAVFVASRMAKRPKPGSIAVHWFVEHIDELVATPVPRTCSRGHPLHDGEEAAECGTCDFLRKYDPPSAEERAGPEDLAELRIPRNVTATAGAS